MFDWSRMLEGPMFDPRFRGVGPRLEFGGTGGNLPPQMVGTGGNTPAMPVFNPMTGGNGQRMPMLPFAQTGGPMQPQPTNGGYDGSGINPNGMYTGGNQRPQLNRMGHNFQPMGGGLAGYFQRFA